MDNRFPSSTRMDQISTAQPSVVADESDSDLCDSSSSPDITEQHRAKQESRQSYYSTDSSLQIAVGNRTAERPKKKVSLSTTENVDGIDITAPGQGLGVLDETDAKPCAVIPTYMLNFERPKSGFDSLSWNALPLAITSSFLPKRMQLTVIRLKCLHDIYRR